MAAKRDAPKQITFTTMGGKLVTYEEPVHSKTTVPRGYASWPGSGPAGERCKTCKHIAHFRKWAKCELNKARWTGGRGSDIKVNSPACKLWQSQSGSDSPAVPNADGATAVGVPRSFATQAVLKESVAIESSGVRERKPAPADPGIIPGGIRDRAMKRQP